MSKEPLFKVISSTCREGSVSAVLAIDQQNDIFNGHFPGQPVVPGACMLQIVKEVLADALHRRIRLVKADNIKFLSLVQPLAGVLQLQINHQSTNTDIRINAGLSAGDLICMKLQATFAIIADH
jgi:3-hydroxyacyl-[acyl-carrier-protein] dehydratase